MTFTDVRRPAKDAVEDAAITDLALMLTRAAVLAGQRPETLVAQLSDADLAALYRTCAKRRCGARRPSLQCLVSASAGGPRRAAESPAMGKA
ncbi:hypothetical protein [Actinomadura geliboluensis]|uniref:hypothetical protein n=1 Tax=Actinomadura geliboluensis TaxID=882440 RepID=UPI003682CBF8